MSIFDEIDIQEEKLDRWVDRQMGIGVIPEGTTIIDERIIIEDKAALTKVVIPDSVVTIETGVFNSCSSLKSVTILEGVKTIGAVAFSNCSSLEVITLPKGVKKIGKRVFSGANNLKVIYVPPKQLVYYKKRLPRELHDKIVERI